MKHWKLHVEVILHWLVDENIPKLCVTILHVVASFQIYRYNNTLEEICFLLMGISRTVTPDMCSVKKWQDQTYPWGPSRVCRACTSIHTSFSCVGWLSFLADTALTLFMGHTSIRASRFMSCVNMWLYMSLRLTTSLDTPTCKWRLHTDTLLCQSWEMGAATQIRPNTTRNSVVRLRYIINTSIAGRSFLHS